MDRIFLTVLNMSLTASFVIAVVILARLFLRRTPKIISYVLWAVVLFNLLSPFKLESVFSLIPRDMPEITATERVFSYPTVGGIQWDISEMPTEVGGIQWDISEMPVEVSAVAAAPVRTVYDYLAFIWLVGVAVLLIYATVGYIRLKQRVSLAVRVEDNIYETDRINSPFVMGLFRPRIYVPIGIEPTLLAHIIEHERTHIRRRDYLVSVVAFAALALHWFNPVVWAAYVLMLRDMESSCDEAVLRKSKEDIRREYSSALLGFSINRRQLSFPLAFGEQSVKERVKNVLNFKKRSRAMVAIAFGLVILLSAGLAVNGAKNEPLIEMQILYEKNPANFFDDIVLLWDDTEYRVIHVENAERGKEIGYVADETETWQIYELKGHGRDFLFAQANNGAWRVMTSRPVPAPLWQYILENATERQRGERMLSVTLHADGTAILAAPPISSYMPPKYTYTFTDDYLLIHGESGNEIARFLVEENALVFLSATASPTVRLFVDEGARYVLHSHTDETAESDLRNMTIDDLLLLAEKGDNLSFADFREFNGTDVGSGFRIMKYDIFSSVYMGYTGWTDYSLLVRTNGTDIFYAALIHYIDGNGIEKNELADIRYYDVEKFLADGTQELIRPIPEPQDLIRPLPEPRETFLPQIMHEDDNPLPHITMRISDISPSGLSFLFTNTSDDEYIFGEDYSVYVYNNGDWERVQPIDGGVLLVNDIAYIIPPQSQAEPKTVDWSSWLGELPSGRYQLRKEIVRWLRPPVSVVWGDSEYENQSVSHILAREFVIHAADGGENDSIDIRPIPEPREIAIPQAMQENDNPLPHVTMRIFDVSPRGLSFLFTNTGDDEYIFSEDLSIYVYNNGTWEPFEPFFASTHPRGYIIPAQSQTELMMVDWSRLFGGDLPNGRYQLRKEVAPWQRPPASSLSGVVGFEVQSVSHILAREFVIDDMPVHATDGGENDSTEDIRPIPEPRETAIPQAMQENDNPLPHLTMKIFDISPSGLSYFFTNTGDDEYIYGVDYNVYVYNNGEWERVEPIIDVDGWALVGYSISPQSQTETRGVDWSLLLGELPSGRYQFRKGVTFSRSPGDFDNYTLAQEFVIP